MTAINEIESSRLEPNPYCLHLADKVTSHFLRVHRSAQEVQIISSAS